MAAPAAAGSGERCGGAPAKGVGPTVQRAVITTRSGPTGRAGPDPRRRLFEQATRSSSAAARSPRARSPRQLVGFFVDVGDTTRNPYCWPGPVPMCRRNSGGSSASLFTRRASGGTPSTVIANDSSIPSVWSGTWIVLSLCVSMKALAPMDRGRAAFRVKSYVLGPCVTRTGSTSRVPAESLHDISELVGRRCRNRERPARHWMIERQRRAGEQQPLRSEQRREQAVARSAVRRIADDGVRNPRKVTTQLVPASSHGFELEQGVPARRVAIDAMRKLDRCEAPVAGQRGSSNAVAAGRAIVADWIER